MTAGSAIQPGQFITFEGGEGAGKSTQIERLRRRLEDIGHLVAVTREPGGSSRAEAIRDFLLGSGARPFGPVAEAMLFAAARADHVLQTIKPALASATTVLCDRFVDSTRVYQGALGSVPVEMIVELERLTTSGLIADLTLILDVSAELGLQRADARRIRLGMARDRFEEQGLEYHEGIRRGFLAIAEAEPRRCVIIDGSRSEDEVATSIWSAVTTRLGLAQDSQPHAV